MALWLQRLREAAAAKEPLVEYARRHGLKPSEAYRWRQKLRRAGRWPGISANTARASQGTVAAATPHFARVRIAAEQATISPAPLRLQLQLSNGRRAELLLSDEQLPRVLPLLGCMLESNSGAPADAMDGAARIALLESELELLRRRDAERTAELAASGGSGFLRRHCGSCRPIDTGRVARSCT